MKLHLFLKHKHLAVGWTLLILLLICIPARSVTEKLFLIPYIDKLIHLFLFGVFAFLWGKVSQKRHGRKTYSSHLIFIAGTLYSVFLELLQQLPFIGRTFDYYDMLANSAGACLIYVYRIKSKS
jgi:glycopeptide antibiotics resistance protein